MGRPRPENEEEAARRWPYCSVLQGCCLAHSAARQMGTRPLTTLLTFVATADTGARLTLQRNREWFTVQVTDAVERTDDNQLALEELRQIGELFPGRNNVQPS